MIALGSRQSEIALILEQPNKYEIGVGKPLTGLNTRLFTEELTRCGIHGDCYVTFALKDCNESSKTYVGQNKKTKEVSYSAQATRYKEGLIAELERLPNLRVVITCGNVPLHFLTGLYSYRKWRGSILKYNVGGRELTIIPTYTPWEIQFEQELRLPLTSDLKKAVSVLHNTYTPTERELLIRPSFNKVMQFLDDCERRGMAKEEISYDIEVNNYHDNEREAGLIPQVSMISFGNVDLQAICINFTHESGDYFPSTQEVLIWKRIAELLSNPNIRKVGQYVQFDAHFLLRTYGIRCRNMHCTAIAQHTITSELPKGLDFITSIWTDHKYYKEDGKALFAGDVCDIGFKYNATDSVICSESFPKQRQQLHVMHNWEAYDRQRKLIEPLTYMMEHGLKTDIEGMQRQYGIYREEIAELERELKSVCGANFNPRSPKSLHDYFYGKLHLKPYKKRNAKGEMAVSYDEIAMKRIARKGYKEASLIQRVKHLGKVCAGYLDVTKVDKDGRYRCFYDPTGTAFSRLASKENIFGTGSNLQNWPKELRQYFLIDEGYIGYSIDLSQAENRIVAFEGRVIPMMEAFKNNQDVHTLTTRLILTVLYGKEQGALIDPRSYAENLGDGSHTWRDWGKKANHGFNYDWGYIAFALKNEMPENDGKLIYTSYHAAYPEIQRRYHASIKDSLRRTRSITNLMGRKTYFFGELNDQLFKAGYSCIPQGTVGDIINEHGLEYIWYNGDFDDVELLTQTHDEIIFQIPLNERVTLHDHARIVSSIIKSLEVVLTTSYGEEFVIPCDLTMLKSLYPKTGGEGVELPSDRNVTDIEIALKGAREKLWKPQQENCLIC